VLLILLDLSQSFGGICDAHLAGFIPVFWWDMCCSSCWIYPNLLVGSVLLILLDLSQSFGGICVAHLAGDWDKSSKMSNTDHTKRLG
jgi:hypothetical protein